MALTEATPRNRTVVAIQPKLIALQGGVSGDTIEACKEAVISGFTGGTVGGLLYLEEGAGVGGGYTETAPATTGDVNTIIGYILAADTVLTPPSVRAGSVA